MSISESPQSLSNDSVGSSELSEYEKLRAKNIEKHNALLRNLGLISAQEELESNALAWQKPLVANGKRKREEDTKKAAKKATKTSSKPSRYLTGNNGAIRLLWSSTMGARRSFSA